MTRLKVATYNVYKERNGRDAALDALLADRQTLSCLQEVSPRRAWEIQRRFRKKAYVSPVKHGVQFLALVLPESASFVSRRTVHLNSRLGLVPSIWSLRRSRALYKAGHSGWSDGLEPRAAQVTRISWNEQEFQVINTHLPYEESLRNRCLLPLAGLVDSSPALLAGDLNAVPGDPSLKDLWLGRSLLPAGPDEPTHETGHKVDYVLFGGGFRESGYVTQKGLSDHLLIKVELEV